MKKDRVPAGTGHACRIARAQPDLRNKLPPVPRALRDSVPVGATGARVAALDNAAWQDNQ